MKNTEKTVIEWLNEAKEQGYEWAQTAIDLVNNGVKDSYMGENVNPLSEHLSLSYVLVSMLWTDTPQGHDFWEKTYKSLLEKGL